MYVPTVDDNLFEPLSKKARADIKAGDGGELQDTKNHPAKMRALHSSSALGVNIFQYWNTPDRGPVIAEACGLCRNQPDSQTGTSTNSEIRFEQKLYFGKGFSRPSNMDVLIANPNSRFEAFAVECKFSEAYTSRGHPGLKEKYLNEPSLWTGLSNLEAFARGISPEDTTYHHLHPAQLVKHILGLTRKYGKERYRLLYLWYDGLGGAGSLHREEIARFTDIAKKDGVRFHSLSYQELIARLVRTREGKDGNYLDYISGRYL